MTAFRHYKNTSDFLDTWARPVCEWIAERFNLRRVHLTIRRGDVRSGCGRAWWGQSRATCTISRHKFRRDWQYATIAWDKKYVAATPLESFVMLIAHELHHLSAEAIAMREEAKDRTGHWRQSFEFQTQKRAWEAVEEYRRIGRKFIAAHAKAIRSGKRKHLRIVKAKAAARTPEAKLAKIESRLAVWQKRQAQAERFVHKYRAKLNRTRAAMAVHERRVAATPS